MSLNAAISDALNKSDRRGSADAVHQIISNELRELDPHAELAWTGYFNHSWAPDFVMKWDGGARERQVFLRFDVRHASFLRDVQLLAENEPAFVGLPSQNGETTTVDERLPLLAAKEQTLVTETDALPHLHAKIAGHREARTAVREVMRGGRGFVDVAAADTIIRSVDTAAREIATRNRDALRSELDRVESYLNRESVLRFERVLRAWWIENGSEPSDFPGIEDWDLGTRSIDEIVELIDALLAQTEDVPAERWHELAVYVTADAFGAAMRSRGPRRGGRLNDFVRAAIGGWTAQWAYAPALPSDTFEGTLDWSVTHYGLGLHLINRDVYFSDDGRRFSHVPDDSPLPEVATRLPVLRDASVIGLGLLTLEEDLSITLRETATHSIAYLMEELFQQDSPAWRTARISEMTVRVQGLDAEVHIDFRRAVINATRPLPLRTFTEVVARFVAAIPEEELDELRSSVTESVSDAA